MASVSEVMQLCRLCLVKDEVNIPIFEEQGDIRQIFLKISACLPVKVARDDNLPKRICDGCSCKLEMLYQFWHTSAQAEKKLIKWINEITYDKSANKVISTVQHSNDPMILKQEVVDVGDTHSSSDELVPEDLNASDDAQDYLMQQQQLPYQNVEYFEEDGLDEEPIIEAPTLAATQPKRKRRAAEMQRAITANTESEDEDDVDHLLGAKITKTEEQSDEGDDPEPTTFVGLPTATDNEQPGPSGVGKSATDAPSGLGYQIIWHQPKRKGLPKKFVRKDATECRRLETAMIIKEEIISDDELPMDNLPEVKFVCHVCKTEEKMTEKQLRMHFREHHKGKRLRSLKLHVENAVQCDICPKFFRTTKSLKEHMETHSNQFNCDRCNANFKKILDYTLHLRLHSDENLFKCILCEFKTDSINDITEHFNNLHEKNHQYKCGKCGKGFHVLSWYLEHENYHSGNKPFRCDFCEKSFLYSRHLVTHRILAHKEECTKTSILHECVICKKQYQHKNSLKLHMNVHTGNVSVCDICGRTLSSKEKLKFHMRTHTGYKPFSCSYCGKCFTKKPILVEHERIHTGEKPYSCNFCSRKFSQRSSLVIHIRGHTGERPYVCHLCTKGFVARAMLNIHFKTCRGMLD